MQRKTLIISSFACAAVLLAGSGWADGPQYKIVNLGNPNGGSISQGTSNNAPRAVAGFAYTAGNAAVHAELWRRDQPPLDLGTLGGPNSGVAWPNRNSNGIVVGIAETADPQPLGEPWSCALAVFNFNNPSFKVCRGFKWQDGHMTELPTLGGGNGFATGVNELGVAVGWAETTVNDTTCVAPQVQQFLPVFWSPDNRAHALPTIPGDPDGSATAINQLGQIVGITGRCDQAVGRFSAIHAVMWEGGKVIDLGNIGGNSWNTPMDVNNWGEVVGFADLAGDPTGNNPTFHAFLWTREQGMVDLGTLAGDAISEALGVKIGRAHV